MSIPALRMTWHDLLFAHWPVPAAALRSFVPPRLEIETFDSMAWIGVVPFRMTRVRPLGLWLPGDAFAIAEVNLRTYVRAGGETGVWFFSLDGSDAAAAFTARSVFGIEYRHAAVELTADRGEIHFSSDRRRPVPAMFAARYRPIGAQRRAAPGSLEEFLTNRLSLFGVGRSGAPNRARIEHRPWPLQEAEAEIQVNTLASSLGIQLPDEPPLLHFASRLEVVGRWPRPLP
jgi:uncharacterized protein YqjF (DUF2071 family)